MSERGGLTKSAFLKRLVAAEKEAENRLHHNGSFFAAGLASEGWIGGYLAALRDVEALLTHGYPNDERHFWMPHP